MAEPVTLVSKPKRAIASSAVWTYFGFEADEGGKPKNASVAVCRLCEKQISTKTSNTTNLFSHLRTHHPAEYNIVKGLKMPARNADAAIQSTIGDALALATKYSRNSRRWKELTDAVTHCIVRDMLPVYTVQKEGFREMLLAFDSRYQLPSRRYYSRMAIPALYAQVREAVCRDLKQAQYYCGTTNLWSSVTSEPYISFTVHYIDENWKLHSKCLQTLYMPQDHTGVNIADVLSETLAVWELSEEKLVCLTSDSGSNVVSAAQHLDWARLSCFGHNLHNAVTDSIKDDSRVSRAVGVCKKIVCTFSHSWKKRRDLAKAQSDLKLPEHSLVTVSFSAGLVISTA